MNQTTLILLVATMAVGVLLYVHSQEEAARRDQLALAQTALLAHALEQRQEGSGGGGGGDLIGTGFAFGKSLTRSLNNKFHIW